MEGLFGGINKDEVLWGIVALVGFLFYFAPSILLVPKVLPSERTS